MLTPWVGRIIFANVAVFLVLQFLPGASDFATTWLALVPSHLPSRPWTLITYAFLHREVAHIVFDMLVLFLFGPRVELHLRSGSFLGLYLVSAAGGALLSYITPHVPVMGASGATLGVTYAYAKYWPRAKIFLFGFIPLEARVAIILMIAIALYGGIRGGGNTATFAHLGGVLGGYFYLRLHDLRAARSSAQPQPPYASREDLYRWAKIRREAMHEVNREEFDRIMEKIDKEGVGSVTPQERLFLDNFSDRAGAEN